MTWVHVAGDDLAEGCAELSGDRAHYLGRVLRGRPGDEVTLFDGAGRWALARITRLTAVTAHLEVGEVHTQPRPTPTIEAEVALLKGERMDLCVQKLTELGVDVIRLVSAERSVVRWSGARREQRVQRYRDIACAAAAQSQRAWLPSVEGPVPVAELEARAGCSLGLFAGRRGPPLSDAMQDWTSPVRFAIGPEGGFSDPEREHLVAIGYRPVSLGRAILRAETAALAAATLVGFVAGRYG